MKTRLFLIAITTFVFIGCSKDELTNHQQHVDDVEVQFSTEKIISTSQNFSSQASEKMATINSVNSFDRSYEHAMPDTFTAYFVANETKGQYTEGQIVKELEVSGGTNTITVPQMDMHVYVTNYVKQGDWFTWSDAIQQMPQTSKELFMFGDKSINYNEVTDATVEIYNPYAAVMIMNNQYINGAPKSYDTQQEYDQVTEYWYNLYIRKEKTNTMVPIAIPGNYNEQYTLDRAIEANKIYQFELTGDVLNHTGDFKVVVKPLEEGDSEIINVW